MVNYRRSSVPGACYFLTLVLQDRSRDWLVRYSGELRESLQQTIRERPFRLPAAVVLPDHLHLLMALPEGDADFSSRVRRFKSLFVGRLKSAGAPLTFNGKGEADAWQRRFWEHLIRNESDFADHVDYIHANPLKHGLVERVRDWPLSSFHRHVQLGVLPSDWGGSGGSLLGRAGE